MRPITSLYELQPGDHIQHVRDASLTFMVTANYGDRITAVASCDITNPPEWVIVAKANLTAAHEEPMETPAQVRLLRAIRGFDSAVDEAQALYNELHPKHKITCVKLQRKPKPKKKPREVFQVWKCPACAAMVSGVPLDGPCPKCGEE